MNRKKWLLVLGALFAPLGLGTLMLFMVHGLKLLDPRTDALVWFPLTVGLVCYLALLEGWLKRLVLGMLYFLLMSVLWIGWGITFSCWQFGSCP